MRRSVGRAGPVTVEWPAVFPGRPDDTRHAIGESHGGDVVTALTLARQGALAQTVKWTAGALLAMGGHQRRAGTVHQQGAQVDVAPLGDAAESATLSTGVLSRGQSQPGSEASSVRKALDITDGGAERRAGEQSHTRYLP